MNLTRYTDSKSEEWNTLIAESRNGTFLLDRRFMDYHAHRFHDCSLMFMDKNRCVAVLPANFDESTRTVYSHQGLTYGGLIMHPTLSVRGVMECFSLFIDYYRTELGAERIIYKPIPYIYNTYPADDDLYALFRNGAKLIGRGISQCIQLDGRPKITEARKGGIRKANAAGITVKETKDITGFWTILNEVLTSIHNTKPVHTPDELSLLIDRFPERIKLYASMSAEGAILAGALIFDFGNVVHTQYLASSIEGKSCGALDLLISHLIDEYSDRTYFDFGISTEQGGAILNEGLAFQKEGFGGRGICYDQYCIE